MRHLFVISLLFAMTTTVLAVDKMPVNSDEAFSPPIPEQTPLRERTGDTCDDAIQITYWPFSESGTTSDNTNTYGDYSAPDEWYRISLPGPGNVYIGLCPSSYDTYLYLLSDDCSTELAANDDSCGLQSELNVNLSAGSYKICVDGYGSGSGNYTLEVETDIPMHGDSCDDPIPIDDIPFSDQAMSFGYNDTGFEPSADVFYQFLVESSGLYTFTTCQTELHEYHFDTHLVILAEDCNAVVAENYDDCDGAYSDWSTITHCLAQGLYYLMVEGESNEEGGFIIDIVREGDCTPCYPPVCPSWGIDEVEPNNGADAEPPAYDNFAYGEIHCGTIWSAAASRDSDWYQFSVSEPAWLHFHLDGEEGQNLELTLVDESSGSPVILAYGELDNECSDYVLFDYTVDAGTYSIRVAYDDYYAEEPVSEYTLAWIPLQGTGSPPGTPADFQLAQNYPNPFNPSTTIEFTLPFTQPVQLAVFDVSGKQVALLLNDVCQSGTHSVQFDASRMPSGVYFYRLTAPDKSVTRKMILVK
jgi:hypothetical protein